MSPKVMFILWMAYAAILGFTLGGSFVSAYLVPDLAHTSPNNSCPNGQQTGAGCQTPQEQQETALAYYTKWLTIFTGILACATIALGIVTIGLYFTGEKQIEVALRATKAAVGVKLPHFILTDMSLYQPGPPFGREFFADKITGGGPPARSQVAITVHNIGETAAIRTAICIRHFVGLRLPPVPVYDVVIPEAAGTITNKESPTTFEPRNYFIELDPSEVATVGAVSTVFFLWVYGFIAFKDFMGEPHEFRFCARWRPHPYFWGEETGFTTDSQIPAEYTKSY